MAGTVVVPWYVTGFRGDAFELALGEVAAAALRYGASSYAVYRARDDRYKFQQLTAFEDQLDWTRYWEGEEMTFFRARHQGWFQVPIVYGWWDQTTAGAVASGPVTPLGQNGHPHGNGAGVGESA